MGTWYEGAIRVNGAHANYERGRNRMEVVKLHYTVGVNSYPIGVRGYFQFLINRDGTIYQFAPVDALCFDAGEWNDDGPGIEVEYHPSYHDEIFNDAMRTAAQGLVRWLHEEHGFPLTKWGEGRIRDNGSYRGFLDHADLIQREQHYDYWPDSDWAFIAGDKDDMGLSLQDFAAIFNGVADRVAGKDLLGRDVRNVDLMTEILEVKKLVARVATPTVDVKALAAELARVLPPDSDADPRAIAEAVRDKFREDPLA